VRKILSFTILLLVISLIYPGSQTGQIWYNDSLLQNSVTDIYRALNDTSINPKAFELALLGHQSLASKGVLSKENLLTIIDYSRPSSDKRFFVIDLESECIVFKTLVAHGKNSGELYASRFSNKAQSHQSAIGFFVTGSSYKGGQGYSLLVSGIDTGFNDNARKRAIVIHGANYVTSDYIQQYGRLGRSFGCPALPPDINASVINLIKEGSLIFSYYPDQNYLSHSRILSNLPQETGVSATL
jgi:hypothetical protein